MVAVFIEKAMYMYATLLIFFYGKFFFINYLSNWVAVVKIIVADLFNLDRRVFFLVFYFIRMRCWSQYMKGPLFFMTYCDMGRSCLDMLCSVLRPWSQCISRLFFNSRVAVDYVCIVVLCDLGRSVDLGRSSSCLHCIIMRPW